MRWKNNGMSTKDRILEAALRQFNELGTDQTTLRSLAEELGISHGNLCYHFKNTDALIEALYDCLIAEIEEQVIQSQHPDNELEEMVQQAETTFRLLYKYRFLLLDLVRITRRIESIRQKFRAVMQLRRLQFHVTFGHLVRRGLMREEWVPGLHDRLITNLLVLGDNWIPNAEIHFDEKGESVIRYYFEAFKAGLMPYLTEQGMEAFR
ncbi:MAG: TetR family transcriptional regulator [Saprospirales bacterium]|nr:TetR family transcriptional regulator [Saprospirales bacterium]